MGKKVFCKMPQSTRCNCHYILIQCRKKSNPLCKFI